VTDRSESVDPLEVMSREDCESRLRSGYLGRLAVNVDGAPMIYPMNYRYVNGAVHLRTRAGARLAMIVAEGPVPAAFEIDRVDETYHTGWSVVVRGRLEIADEETIRDVLRAQPLRPWAAGQRDYWLRLSAAAVSGRAVT
jgi:uncharacterized protein